MNDTWPDGWGYEPGDPGVGIFGETFTHEDCPTWDEDLADSEDPTEVEDLGHVVIGEGAQRQVKSTIRLTCKCCQQTVEIDRYDWDPDFGAEPDFGYEYEVTAGN